MAAEFGTYVLFELAGTTYAIPSSNVQHIEMLDHITIVPNAHRAIDGVVFSRGQVIPALNLRVRFGFPREEPTMRTRILFAQVQKRTVGLVVDSAREFRKISDNGIRPIEQELAGVSGNYLKGLTTVNERLVLILDLDAVLNLDEDPSLDTSLSEILNRAPSVAPTTTTTLNP
jgi:purine-binding chemotaxis protein CheW